MQLELRHVTQVSNLTRAYPFEQMGIGDFFTVFSHFQHARVAASEFAHKHNQCYSCRMQPDDPVTGQRSMRVYRIEGSQDEVDKRGRNGHRRIPLKIEQPTKNQFMGWLNTFQSGQHFEMPTAYAQSFPLMQAWTELYSLKTSVPFKSALQPNGTLLIARAD